MSDVSRRWVSSHPKLQREQKTPRVLVVCEWLPTYLLEFFGSLSEALQGQDVDLTVVYGNPVGQIAQRQDGAQLAWGVRQTNRVLPLGDRSLVWQPCTDEARQADLVIVDQASRLLLNYWLLAQQWRRCTRVAFWGHGANLNSLRASPMGEAIKRYVSRRPHWWFAYTEGTKERVVSLGYPEDRITITQNAGATETLRQIFGGLDSKSKSALPSALGIKGRPFGLFLGSLYEDKRLDYLIEAADAVVEREPAFMLVIAGEGPARQLVVEAAASRPHVLYVGRVGLEQKAMLLKNASALLLPGAVGLAVVDGFVAGVPTITTAVPTHGPEFEYIDDGESGIVLPASARPNEYAEAIVSVLRDGDELRLGATRAGTIYTSTSMVARFVDGVTQALAAEPLRGKR